MPDEAYASPILDRFGQRITAAYLNGNSLGYPSNGSSGSTLFRRSNDSQYRRYRPQCLEDIARQIPQYHQRALIADARYIYASGGGMVAGAVHKKADYAVGDAWEPQYKGNDPAWKKIAEAKVSDWCKLCEIRGRPYDWNQCLWLASVAFDRDGDSFCVLTRDPDTNEPRLQFIEAHRIGSLRGENEVSEGIYKGKAILNGIVYDDFMRPLAYNLLPHTLPITLKLSDRKYNWLPASSVIHFFDPKWFSQGRGIPSLAYGILDWYDISEIRDAEKIAVKVNSAHALIEKNETGARDPASDYIRNRHRANDPNFKQDLTVETIENGLIRYIKTNGSVESFRSDRPGQTWQGFMDHIARGGFLGMDWPIEVAWDMSSVGGAAVRAVVNQAGRSVSTRQRRLEPNALIMVLYTVSSMIDSGDLPFVDDWFAWGFTKPAKFSVDVGRDRQNAREDLAVGLTTLSSSVVEGGGDPEEHFRTRATDFKMAERIALEEGVPVEVVYDPTAALRSGAPQDMTVNPDDEGQQPPGRGRNQGQS